MTLITGASKGIGKGIAEVFAAAGAKLVLVARGEAELARTAGEIMQAGGQAASFTADVSKAADMQRLAEFTVEPLRPDRRALP